MGGYVSTRLEVVVTTSDFLCDFEGSCLVIICETEGMADIVSHSNIKVSKSTDCKC